MLKGSVFAKIIGLVLTLCGYSKRNCRPTTKSAPKTRKIGVDQTTASRKRSKTVLDFSTENIEAFDHLHQNWVINSRYSLTPTQQPDGENENDVVPDAIKYLTPFETVEGDNKSLYDRINGLETQLQTVNATLASLVDGTRDRCDSMEQRLVK